MEENSGNAPPEVETLSTDSDPSSDVEFLGTERGDVLIIKEVYNYGPERCNNGGETSNPSAHASRPQQDPSYSPDIGAQGGEPSDPINPAPRFHLDPIKRDQADFPHPGRGQSQVQALERIISEERRGLPRASHEEMGHHPVRGMESDVAQRRSREHDMLRHRNVDRSRSPNPISSHTSLDPEASAISCHRSSDHERDRRKRDHSKARDSSVDQSDNECEQVRKKSHRSSRHHKESKKSHKKHHKKRYSSDSEDSEDGHRTRKSHAKRHRKSNTSLKEHNNKDQSSCSSSSNKNRVAFPLDVSMRETGFKIERAQQNIQEEGIVTAEVFNRAIERCEELLREGEHIRKLSVCPAVCASFEKEEKKEVTCTVLIIGDPDERIVKLQDSHFSNGICNLLDTIAVQKGVSIIGEYAIQECHPILETAKWLRVEKAGWVTKNDLCKLSSIFLHLSDISIPALRINSYLKSMQENGRQNKKLRLMILERNGAWQDEEKIEILKGIVMDDDDLPIEFAVEDYDGDLKDFLPGGFHGGKHQAKGQRHIFKCHDGVKCSISFYNDQIKLLVWEGHKC